MTEFKFDLDKYDYKIENNEMIIIEKKIKNINDLLELDLTGSSIMSATYDNQSLPHNHNGINKHLCSEHTAKELKDLYANKGYSRSFYDGNIKKSGYYYIEKNNISYYRMSANETWKNIKILLENLTKNYEFKIKLNDDRIVEIKK
jgi:hypothetical protein